jgi:DNA-binding NarL/FixJ family response regulator
LPFVPKIRILLVDDHVDVRTAVGHILNSYADIEVVAEAADGVEAITYVEKLQPDVVIMDISMPHMDGVTATRIIKAQRPDTIILGLSVDTRRRNIEALLHAGATAVLRKETAWEELHDAVSSAMHSVV